MTSVEAMSRFVFPAATRRSTSSSRGDRPCASSFAPQVARDRAPPRAGRRSPARPRARAGRLGRRARHRHARREPGCARLVRRVEGEPDCCASRKRPSAPADRLRREDSAPCVGDHGREHCALIQLGELFELGARRPRLLDVAGRKSDLDVGRKQRRPLERFGDLGACPADRCECRVAFPLREPKLREAWLWFPAGVARLAVRVLGFAELAQQAEKLGLAVMRKPRQGSVWVDACRRVAPPRARRPRSHQLQDLRSVDEAAASEGEEIRLCATHDVSACVHSLARRTSKTYWQARITPQ